MTTAGSLVASVGGSLTCRTSLTVEHLQRVKHLKLQYNCSVGQSAALQPWATAGLQAEADIDSQWPAPHPVTVTLPPQSPYLLLLLLLCSSFLILHISCSSHSSTHSLLISYSCCSSTHILLISCSFHSSTHSLLVSCSFHSSPTKGKPSTVIFRSASNQSSIKYLLWKWSKFYWLNF